MELGETGPSNSGLITSAIDHRTDGSCWHEIDEHREKRENNTGQLVHSFINRNRYCAHTVNILRQYCSLESIKVKLCRTRLLVHPVKRKQSQYLRNEITGTEFKFPSEHGKILRRMKLDTAIISISRWSDGNISWKHSRIFMERCVGVSTCRAFQINRVRLWLNRGARLAV